MKLRKIFVLIIATLTVLMSGCVKLDRTDKEEVLQELNLLKIYPYRTDLWMDVREDYIFRDASFHDVSFDSNVYLSIAETSDGLHIIVIPEDRRNDILILDYVFIPDQEFIYREFNIYAESTGYTYYQQYDLNENDSTDITVFRYPHKIEDDFAPVTLFALEIANNHSLDRSIVMLFGEDNTYAFIEYDEDDFEDFEVVHEFSLD